jgi:hypothetical protein
LLRVYRISIIPLSGIDRRKKDAAGAATSVAKGVQAMHRETVQRDVQALAYQLWEKAGKPDGHAHHFWERAQHLLWHAQARVHEFRVVDESLSN